jgi:type I restriction enzyme S subunit
MASIDQAGAAAEGQLEAAKALPAAYLRQAFQGPEARSWRKTRLGDICEIQLGKMLSPKSRGGYRPRPYLRNANVQWDRFDLSDVSEMDFSDREEQKFALRSGDLIVCEGGEPGRAAVWEGRIRPCYYQKALHRLRPVGNCVDPRFLMYRLWFGATRAEFAQSNAKTTIAHLPAVCSASAGSGESVQPLR